MKHIDCLNKISSEAETPHLILQFHSIDGLTVASACSPIHGVTIFFSNIYQDGKILVNSKQMKQGHLKGQGWGYSVFFIVKCVCLLILGHTLANKLLKFLPSEARCAFAQGKMPWQSSGVKAVWPLATSQPWRSASQRQLISLTAALSAHHPFWQMARLRWSIKCRQKAK